MMFWTSRRVSHLSNSLKDNFIPRDDYQLCPMEVTDALTSELTQSCAVYGICQPDGREKPFCTSQQAGWNGGD